MGARQPRPRRPRRRHRARAPLELRPVAVHREAHGRGLPHDPDRRRRRAATRRARRDRARGQRQGRRQQPRLELARNRQPDRAPELVGARPRGDHGRRRGAVCAAPHRRRAGARLRLPRVLVAQDVRPLGGRRAVGQGGAAGQDVAVQPRRAHDPFRPLRGHDVGSAARTSSRRARSRSPRRSRSAPRSTTSRRSASTRSSSTSTSSSSTRWSG